MSILQPLTLFDDLTPHGYCLLWDPVLIWSHLGSDLAIAGAYLSIPAALVIVGRRRPDLNPGGIFYFFAAFIILCAISHVFGVLTLWYPVYSMEAVAKVMTAIVSVATSVMVWRLLTPILTAPTHAALRDANEKLALVNAELEARVEVRTAELRQAIERYQVAAAEAQEAERVKAEFLARMSHELRTPLNAVIGFTELLSMQLAGPVNATQKGYLGSVRGASAQLLDQINAILDLERLAQHGPSFEPTTLTLQAAVDEACDLLSSMAAEREIALKPRVAETTSLHTDERSVGTVLTNLISNAIKYSRRGGTVIIAAAPVPGGVEITVADQGVGMPEETLDSVFEPFFRGHERSLPNVGGSGLGLTLVKQLVDALGGRVQLRSQPNAGTTVEVFLPSMRDHPAGAGR